MDIDINIESQVSQTITDGVTDKAPSENAVFDALENKANTSDIITDHSELNLDDGTNPHGTTKSDVGLSDVPNLDTTDAVDKAHDSVTLTGTPNYITIVGQVITRGLIDLANHVTGRLGFNHLPTGTARSVVGRAGSGNGDLGNISAGNDTILSRVGSGDVAFNSVSDTKEMLALDNVDNTSDLDKPISTATQDALDLKIGGAVSIGQVAFGTASGVGGDSQLFWDNTNERLGIGTTSFTSKLHVYQNDSGTGTSNGISVEQDGTGDAIIQYILTGTQRWVTGIDNSDFFKFKIASTLDLNTDARFTIDTTGNVGINQSTPTARLHVQSQGALSTDIGFRVRNSANTLDIIRAQGNGSVLIGLGAGNINTGANNSFFGIDSGRLNTTGANNSFFGVDAGRLNTTGANNTANGVSAIINNTLGNNNSAFGLHSLFNNTTGSNNVAVGIFSGRFIADGTTANSITNTSVFIGASTRAQADNQTNQIVIGHDTTGNGSNTVTLGNTSIVDTILRGRVNLTQYATGSRPTYVKGALIYDSTLGKLLVGGNSGWEVVTSM
jgi:hypothetical protein